MGEAKNIIVQPISSSDANRVIKAIHYSGKVVRNSQLHLGVFLNGKCGGAMQFGPSLDKRKLLGLVKNTGWNEFIELNRMAFADWLPRNSESRAIGWAMRWLKNTYPFLKWVVSFSDATQCGDGTIYRASGFYLTQIKKNKTIFGNDEGKTVSDISIRTGMKTMETLSKVSMTKGKHILQTGGASNKILRDMGYKELPGFQLRYIYFLNKECKKDLTCEILPFSEIKKMGARMYKGQVISGA